MSERNEMLDLAKRFLPAQSKRLPVLNVEAVERGFVVTIGGTSGSPFGGSVAERRVVATDDKELIELVRAWLDQAHEELIEGGNAGEAFP